MKTFGFVAEPHRNNIYLYSPATKDGNTGEITCHDLSGFLGSWKMKANGVFFGSEAGCPLDPAAMKQASDYCDKMNNKENK